MGLCNQTMGDFGFPEEGLDGCPIYPLARVRGAALGV